MSDVEQKIKELAKSMDVTTMRIKAARTQIEEAQKLFNEICAFSREQATEMAALQLQYDQENYQPTYPQLVVLHWMADNKASAMRYVVKGTRTILNGDNVNSSGRIKPSISNVTFIKLARLKMIHSYAMDDQEFKITELGKSILRKFKPEWTFSD